MDNIEQEIKAKGLIAPRVTPEDVQTEILDALYFNAAKAAETEGRFVSIDSPLHLLTFCVLVLRNGFTVTGESACASPDNYNEEIGCAIARRKAEEKIWPLLGFRLRDKLHAGVGTPEGTWQDRLLGEYNDLSARVKKLDAFILSDSFANIDVKDRDLLLSQSVHMTEYLRVLEARIGQGVNQQDQQQA